MPSFTTDSGPASGSEQRCIRARAGDLTPQPPLHASRWGVAGQEVFLEAAVGCPGDGAGWVLTTEIPSLRLGVFA
jgi:hypothetical protein